MCESCRIEPVNCSAEINTVKNDSSAPPVSSTPVETTPIPEVVESNITIIVENLTVVNITTVTTEFVNNGTVSSNNGLQEINRIVGAFRNPGSLFTSADDLDINAIICMWAGFGAFALFAIWISQDRNRYKRKHQDNHNIMMLCVIISAIGYLSMAQGHGRLYRYVINDVMPYNLVRFCSMNVTVEGKNQTMVNATDGSCTGGSISFRWMNANATVNVTPLDPPLFYAKYVHWMITTNIILYLLSAQVAAAKLQTTLFVMICNTLMIICGYGAASLRPEGIDGASVPRFLTSKWVFWIFGMMFYVMLLRSLNKSVRRAASRNKHLSKAFNQLFFIVVLVWSLYPFLWIACEGARVISFVAETVAYTILDVLSKLSFGTIFILRVPTTFQLSKKSRPWFLKAIFLKIIGLCRCDGAVGGNGEGTGTPQKKSRNNTDSFRDVSV